MEKIHINHSEASAQYSESTSIPDWDSLTHLKMKSPPDDKPEQTLAEESGKDVTTIEQLFDEYLTQNPDIDAEAAIQAEMERESAADPSLTPDQARSLAEINVRHGISTVYPSSPRTPDRMNDAFSEYYDFSDDEIEQLDLDTRLRIYDAWCRGQMPNVTMAIMNTWTDDFREKYWDSPYAQARLDEDRQAKIDNARSEHPEIYDAPSSTELDAQSNELLSQIPDDVYQKLRTAYETNREQGILSACQAVAEALSLQEIPEVVFKETDSTTLCGDHKDKVITIYTHPKERPSFEEDMDTIAHECFHAYQHQCADTSQTKHDMLYKLNFDAYIISRMDYAGYRNQLVEAEAFSFGQCLSMKCVEASSQPERRSGPRLRRFAQRILDLLRNNNQERI